MKKYLFKLILVVNAMALVSCQHKDLCYNHPHGVSLEVVFDWADAPEAAPRSMRIWFYPIDGGPPAEFQFEGRDGGTVRLAPGKYNVLCMNSDSKILWIRNTRHFSTFEVYTGEESLLASLKRSSKNVPVADGTQGQHVVRAPEALYSDKLEAFTVLAEVGQSVTLRPSLSTCTYELEIRNVKNLDLVAQISGTLSGMAGSVNLSSGNLTGEACIIPFGVTKKDANTVTATFQTFGHCPVPAIPHKIVIYGIMTRGAQQYQVYGDQDDIVTPQIHGAPDQKNVRIILDGLDFPETGDHGGGLSPSIDNWNEIHIDVPM